jgi:acetyl esterase
MCRIKTLLLLAAISLQLKAQSQEKILYKTIDTTRLMMEVYRPSSFDSLRKYPAMVFFFGGGWVGGSTSQFEPHARYFSSRGMICMLVDYRVSNRQHTTPFESLKDAKSAIRFVRQHADEWHIDSAKIIASGGSAGGHLAAATALIDGYNETGDDISISCRPNALVLFNPVIDNSPGGYGYERIGSAYKDFSPLYNIRKGAPPTIIFLGTKDNLIPVETAAYYKKTMEKLGSYCELKLYEGQGHGFFNYSNSLFYQKTVADADLFLQTTGFLSAAPVSTGNK